jgi:hypothetical protein
MCVAHIDLRNQTQFLATIHKTPIQYSQKPLFEDVMRFEQCIKKLLQFRPHTGELSTRSTDTSGELQKEFNSVQIN